MNSCITTGRASPINLLPSSGPCYDYSNGSYTSKKNTWLVPHVIKYRADSDVIVWRCNWGNVCESNCLYAMVKDKEFQMSAPQEESAQI